MEIIYLLIGAAISSGVVWVLAKNRVAAQLSNLEYNKKFLETQISELNIVKNNNKNEIEIQRNKIFQLSQQLNSNETSVRFLKEQVDKLLEEQTKERDISQSVVNQKNEQILLLSKQVSTLETKNRTLHQQQNEQHTEIEQVQKKFTLEFENLANKILDEKSQKFTEFNRTNIDRILNPLNEKIKDFEKKVDETYDKESKQRFSLEREIRGLIELNQQISQEAQNLTNALKGQAKTQGVWGEMILENILEKSGLSKDREYAVQQSFTDDEGKRLQPDIVIYYPGNRQVIIDSKVSLNAYERYCSTDNKTQQDVEIEAHTRAIRNHVNDLSSKNYQDLYQLKSLDYVFMFIPIEPAFLLAIQRDRELWNYAYSKRVLLISPTNLIAVLKIISDLWKIEIQNKNALEIAQKSGDLYDKFVSFVEDLLEIGKKIDATKLTYNEAVNKLHSGKGNLIKRSEDIKELGAKTKKSLPQNLIDRVSD